MSDFIDANVLLEVLLPYRQKPDVAKNALMKSRDTRISPLTVHLYVHFGKKAKLPLKLLLDQLSAYGLTQMGPAEILWATKNYQDNDFEDALQIACAVMEGCDRFVTFDADLAKKYGRFIEIYLLA